MIRVAAVGKVKEKWMREGIADYLKRIQPYEKTEIIEVDDEKAPESNSQAENEAVKLTEGRKLLKNIRDNDYVILLDLVGREMDSEALSQNIEQIHTRGYNRIVFVIGGSLGVSRELIQRADQRWKISVNTFPHQLCRIIVLEQIYRAFRIMHHEPYHK